MALVNLERMNGTVIRCPVQQSNLGGGNIVRRTLLSTGHIASWLPISWANFKTPTTILTNKTDNQRWIGYSCSRHPVGCLILFDFFGAALAEYAIGFDVGTPVGQAQLQ